MPFRPETALHNGKASGKFIDLAAAGSDSLGCGPRFCLPSLKAGGREPRARREPDSTPTFSNGLPSMSNRNTSSQDLGSPTDLEGGADLYRRGGAVEGDKLKPASPDRESSLEVVTTSDASLEGIRLQHTDPAKRAIDVLFSLIGLLLTAPAWVLIPLAIKLEDGGHVFYRDRRLGKGGEKFNVLKFRTMTAGNDLPNVKGHPPEEAITTVGSFLRPMALDELPQLINILRGEMSLVGPRAAPPEESAKDFGSSEQPLREVRGFAERHAVRPGLTGLAQTQAPRDVSYRTKFRYDCFYVENRTLWLDLKLIIYSVIISLLGRWPEIEGRES